LLLYKAIEVSILLGTIGGREGLLNVVVSGFIDKQAASDWLSSDIWVELDTVCAASCIAEQG